MDEPSRARQSTRIGVYPLIGAASLRSQSCTMYPADEQKPTRQLPNDRVYAMIESKTHGRGSGHEGWAIWRQGRFACPNAHSSPYLAPRRLADTSHTRTWN